MLSSHVAGGAVVVGDQIIVSGGQADGKLNPTTEVFDGTAWKRVADLPTPREHLGMATDGTTRTWSVGATCRRTRTARALERYDPKTDSWARARGHARPARRGRRRGGRRAARGGGRRGADRASTTPSSPTTSRPTRGRTCPRCPPVGTGSPSPRSDKTVYAIGGATQPSHTASTGVGEALQIPPRRLQPAPVWRPLKDAPVARQFAGTAVAGGKMWVLGGLTQDAATPAVYGYDPAIDTWTRGPDLPLRCTTSRR